MQPDLSFFREKLTGIIVSIRTPFRKDGAIDWEALPGILDAGVNEGTKCLLLTAGDSHFECLADEEIEDLTRAVCVYAEGKDLLVVAADRYFSTDRAVKFAGFAKECGAHAIMPLPPNWAFSTTPETVVEHWSIVSEVLPVIMVTNRFINRSIPDCVKAIHAGLDRGANLCALKEDLKGDLAQAMAWEFGEKIPVFAGGSHHLFLNMWLYGACGFMSSYPVFSRGISRKFLDDIQNKRIREAARMIQTIEVPIYEYMTKFPGGINAGFHGLMELHGLCGRWRRPPYTSLSDEEMCGLEKFARSLGLLN